MAPGLNHGFCRNIGWFAHLDSRAQAEVRDREKEWQAEQEAKRRRERQLQVLCHSLPCRQCAPAFLEHWLLALDVMAGANAPKVLLSQGLLTCL